MNAYTVVGPTKVQPRWRRSFESAAASGGTPSARSRATVTRFGRVFGRGANRQT